MSRYACRRLWSPEEGIECPGTRVKYSGSEPPDVGAGNSLGSLKEQQMLIIAASSLHSLIFFNSFSMFSVCIFFFS